MLILDFRTGKMTKLALDLGDAVSVVGPGVALGLGGAGFGYLIDMLAGTNRRWTKILGLLGLAGGAGAGGLLRYLNKRDNTHEMPKTLKTYPEQLLRFARETSKRASEEDLRTTYGTNEQINEAANAYVKLSPSDIFDDLVGDTTSPGWFWSYSPSEKNILKYQIARYFLYRPQSLDVVNLARFVALQAQVLTLYKDKIAPELQEDIEKDFQGYVTSVKLQLRSKEPNWETVHQRLAKITTTLRNNGHDDIAYLLVAPSVIFWEPETRTGKY